MDPHAQNEYVFSFSYNASSGENRLFEGQRPSWIHTEGHGLSLHS